MWTFKVQKLARRYLKISLWIIVGGAATRPGTKYILQAYKPATPVRLITFASFGVGYVLEFGDGYIRFYYHGSPIIETGIAITAATKANPCVLTIPGHTYSVGEWIYMSKTSLDDTA